MTIPCWRRAFRKEAALALNIFHFPMVTGKRDPQEKSAPVSNRLILGPMKPVLSAVVTAMQRAAENPL